MDNLLTFRFLRSPSGRGGAPAGFTLIEVLVALSILTIAMTAVYRLQSQTMAMSARARFYTIAPLLAQARLAEIERAGFEDPADGSGDFGQDYPGYTWSVRTEEVQTDLLKDRPYHLLRIELAIEQNEEELYELRTYRFYPDE